MSGLLDETPGHWGYLALIELCASAMVDGRLTNNQRRVLTLLASHAGKDDSCCVTTQRIADRMGVTRQAVQAASRVLERAGYFVSQRRALASGGEGGKFYFFNLTLEGAEACPIPMDNVVKRPERDQLANQADCPPGQSVTGHGGRMPKGGATSRSCTPLQPPEVAPLQPAEVAHKKPFKETNYKETNAAFQERPDRSGQSGQSGQGPPDRAVDCEQGVSGRQRRFTPPFAGGRRNRQSGDSLVARIDAHNLDRQRDAAGRLWADWARLDPELTLVDLIGGGRAKVWDRARDVEMGKRGSGCRYVAGAVERATCGRVTARDILSGRYARALKIRQG